MTTKNIKIALFGALIIAMILPFTGMGFAKAEVPIKVDEILIPEPKLDAKMQPLSEFEGVIPELISEDKSNTHQAIVVKDTRAAELLGDNYKYSSTAQYLTESGWQPELSFLTDDGKNTVTVTLKDGKVVNVDKYETVTWTHAARGFAVDEYNGSYSMRGNSMVADIPTYSHQAGSFTVLLLNAQKSGSTDADVCTSSKAPTSYWGQVGMQFDSNGVRVGYTDTLKSCNPSFFSIPYSAGDSMKYRIYIDDASDNWYMWVDNLSDGNPPYAFVRNVSGSSLLDNDTPQTSVWYENPNASTVNWDPGFSADPVVDYASFQWTDNVWYYWTGELKSTIGCHTGATTGQLMSGAFVGSPHNVTFDVSNMDSLCGQS